MKTKATGKESLLKSITKRDGSIVSFDHGKITNAVSKALHSAKEYRPGVAEKVTEAVVRKLSLRKSYDKKFVPTVEGVQDLVEMELMLQKFTATAKAYILYRAERSKAREQSITVPQEVKDKINESSKYFKSPYQEFIFYQFYSKWRGEMGRRETWVEAIDSFMDYMKEKMGNKITAAEYSEVREAILNQEICPSMRLLWSAGKACEASNVCAYNCAYIAPVSWRDLSEIMYVSMCGAGCGFSVEPENVCKFPQIKKQTGHMAPKIVIEDSKEGWCKAFVEACTAWEKGKDVELDYSLIRPAGAKLATMGGRASGPAPLQELMQFTKRKMLAKQGRRLTTLDLHDIICQIGLIVVAGGVRRSAPSLLLRTPICAMPRRAPSGRRRASARWPIIPRSMKPNQRPRNSCRSGHPLSLRTQASEVSSIAEACSSRCPRGAGKCSRRQNCRESILAARFISNPN